MSLQFNLSWTSAPSIGKDYNSKNQPINASSNDNHWKFQESPMYHLLINVLATIQTTSSTNVTSPTVTRPHDLSSDQPRGTTSFPIAEFVHPPSLIVPGTGAILITDGLNVTSSGATAVWGPWTLSLIVLAGAILSILTFGMNLMVMVSFKVDRQLQTISNYFLFSLAVADFTIGLISIPFMTLYTALGNGHWVTMCANSGYVSTI